MQLRWPLCPLGSRLATTNWHEATHLEKEVIRAAMKGELAHVIRPSSCLRQTDNYLQAKEATAKSKCAIGFDRDRLEIAKRHF